MARCSAVAESVGITTRPCETPAVSGAASRKARMWPAWISAKSVDSSALTTLLVRKFMPCAPANRPLEYELHGCAGAIAPSGGWSGKVFA